MSHRDSTDSSSTDALGLPFCAVCDQPAVGLGPFSRAHLCDLHLSVDVADALKLKDEVDHQLSAYSQALRLGEDAKSLRLRLQQLLQHVDQRFDQVQRDLDSFRASVRGPLESVIEAVRVCERDQEDVCSYKKEVATAEAKGDIAELVNVVESMQLSLGDLEADIEKAARLQREQSDREEQQLWLLGELERLMERCAGGVGGGDGSRDATVTGRPEMKDAESITRGSLLDQMGFSHEVKLDDYASWLAVCSDTSGFVSDRSGRVVPAEPAEEGSQALPQPCVIALCTKIPFIPGLKRLHSELDHLVLLSLDGSQRLQCHCEIDWNNSITGLHCKDQQLLVAQPDAVTLTDLSGRKVRLIRPRIEGFGDISGVGGNAASVFVSSGNKIAAFSLETGQIETVITLSQLPRALMGNMVIHDNYTLVRDWKRNQVHRVRIDTQQLVASYPTQASGLEQFAGPVDVAVDRRGRLFVSEFYGHSVRALAVDDGSLLKTLELANESGSGGGRLLFPCGLAVVTVGQREQLLVADQGRKRLLVFAA